MVIVLLILVVTTIVAADNPIKSVDMPIEYGQRRNDGEWSIFSWKNGMVVLILIAFMGNFAFLRNACFSK